MSNSQPQQSTDSANLSPDSECPEGLSPDIWQRLLDLRKHIDLADRFFTRLNSDGSRGVKFFARTSTEIADLAELRTTPEQCVLDLHAWVRDFHYRVRHQCQGLSLPDVPPAPVFSPRGPLIRPSEAVWLAYSDAVTVLLAWAEQAAAALRGWKNDGKDCGGPRTRKPNTPAQATPPRRPVPGDGKPPMPLTSWPEILAALNEPHHPEKPWKDNDHTRQKLRKLNDKHNGPIRFGKKGQQPVVEKGALLEWVTSLHDHLDARINESQQEAKSGQLSAGEYYLHGRDEVVAPGIGGSIRTRKQK